jgi:pyruvate kinase
LKPNTKIVATLGPASDPIIGQLLSAGVDVFRLNASHGTQAEHKARIDRVRALARESGKYPAVLLDLQGPKIRLGTFLSGGCVLPAGGEFTITTQSVTGDCGRAATSYVNFARDVKAGDRILLADGSVELRALAADGIAVRTQVVRGGPIRDHQGINLPGAAIRVPCLSDKDLADLQFGLAAGIDMVALSFVRTQGDVRLLRTELKGADVPIIAKIEKPQAWDNIESILDETNGVMVARGDLGVEISLEKVPRIQKSIIRRARRKGRVVITATQMLESMIEHPVPTRAEVSDVANAIYDGTDAVMLSAETSVGKYPAEAVDFMARIAVETEVSIRNRGYQEPPTGPQPSSPEIVADAAYRAAREAKASAVVVFTASGASARLVSRYRPPVPIYAFTPTDGVARQLAVNYGITPILVPEAHSFDEMMAQMDRLLVERGHTKSGDAVVFIAGQPIGRAGTTNLMKLHRVGMGS